MKQRTLSCCALVLLLSLIAVAQDAAKPGQMRRFSRKAASFSGTVSDDGKFFLADPDSEVWMVTNPEAVKSHQGHRVTLQAQTTSETNEIRVLCVKPSEAELRSSAKPGDAAFRR